jgi:hypothetical protein
MAKGVGTSAFICLIFLGLFLRSGKFNNFDIVLFALREKKH